VNAIDRPVPSPPGRPTWANQRAAIARRLAVAGIESAEAEARWLIETASGYEGIEWMAISKRVPHANAQAHLDAMVERRLAGEPLQYALGSWAFRELDLLVDQRVLIPRPETEWVVEAALEEAVRVGLRRGGRAALDAETNAVVADLGTGSGAIALALAAELPDVTVWATDASPDALTVARANVAGCAATRVRLAGVICNRVGSPRHTDLLRAALAPLGIPLLGALVTPCQRSTSVGGTGVGTPSRSVARRSSVLRRIPRRSMLSATSHVHAPGASICRTRFH